jgi:hypothetical protein
MMMFMQLRPDDCRPDAIDWAACRKAAILNSAAADLLSGACWTMVGVQSTLSGVTPVTRSPDAMAAIRANGGF